MDEVEVASIVGVVDAVDLQKRKITLTLDSGKQKTFKVDKAAVNLDQVKPGDHVKASYTEELLVMVSKKGETPGVVDIGGVSLAPKGAKPDAVIVDTTAISGEIVAIDAKKRKVTLLGPDGKTKTVKVKKDVDLSGIAAGESIDAALTESVVIDVTK